jgi:hypothetical protein
VSVGVVGDGVKHVKDGVETGPGEHKVGVPSVNGVAAQSKVKGDGNQVDPVLDDASVAHTGPGAIGIGAGGEEEDPVDEVHQHGVGELDFEKDVVAGEGAVNITILL